MTDDRSQMSEDRGQRDLIADCGYRIADLRMGNDFGFWIGERMVIRYWLLVSIDQIQFDF